MEKSVKCIWSVVGPNWTINSPGFIDDSPAKIAKEVIDSIFFNKKEKIENYFNSIGEDPILPENVLVFNDALPEDCSVDLSVKKMFPKKNK